MPIIEKEIPSQILPKAQGSLSLSLPLPFSLSEYEQKIMSHTHGGRENIESNLAQTHRERRGNHLWRHFVAD